MRCAPQDLTRSPRAPPRVVERDLTPSANSWPCSWPLPAITTTSPGSASAIARRDRRARSTSTSASAARSPVPARISAMIASGSSERGLSEVTITRSAAARRSRPSRPLAAVAVAAGAEDQDDAAVGQAAGRAQHVLQRVRACGRSRRGRRTAGPRRRARSGRARGRRSASARRSRVPATPSARAAATAPSTLATLKRPGSGERHDELAVGAVDHEARALRPVSTSRAR